MKHIVVLSGSGISVESGLSTFRDNGGLWEGYNVNEVATLEGWKTNKSKVLDFYNVRRTQAWNAKPNKAHLLLKKLESHAKVTIITQNVDNLHEKAGNSTILHLHGELTFARSEFDCDYRTFLGNRDIKIGDLCPKGYQLRPDIVWFGEPVTLIEDAIKIVEKADIFLIIGTSLTVYPASGLVHYVRKDVPLFVIDPNTLDNINSYQIKQYNCSAGTGMELFINDLINSSLL